MCPLQPCSPRGGPEEGPPWSGPPPHLDLKPADTYILCPSAPELSGTHQVNFSKTLQPLPARPTLPLGVS